MSALSEFSGAIVPLVTPPLMPLIKKYQLEIKLNPLEKVLAASKG